MRTRDKVLVGTAFGLMTGSIVVTGVFEKLLEPPRRILVVTMEQGVSQDARERLRADCGGLPGVVVVPDRGDADRRRQARFFVRFDIGRATFPQEAAVQACVDRHDQRWQTVRGYEVEGVR